MRTQSLLALFALACLPALVLLGPADTSFGAVDLINNSGFGNSWHTGADWSDGQPAHAGDDYNVGNSATGKSLRTPNNASNPTFPGDSLTIHSTGTLGMKHNGTAQIADLLLDGGSLSSWVGNRTMGFGGTLTVLSASTLNVSNSGDSRRIVIHSLLSGGGDLNVAGADSNDYVQLTNAGNTYTGNWSVSGGRLEAQGAGSLGTGNVTVNSGARIDVDYDLNYSADWILDGAMVLDQTHTLGNLSIGTRQIADGTYSFADLNASYNGNFVDGGSGSITVTGGAGPSVYELNKGQPYGNSWNTGADWTNTADSSTGVVPGLGTIANVAGVGLRTPMGSGTYTFWGTLNLKAGSALGLKTSGTAELYDGHLQGGTLMMSLTTNGTASFGGNIAVDSDSSVSLASTGSDHRTIILSADLSGSGGLDVYGGTGYGTLRLTGDNSGYSGDWLFRDYARLEAQGAGSLGTGNVAVNGGAQINVDYALNYSADWTLDGAMVLDQDHSIGALTIGTLSVPVGTYSYGFLNAALNAHFPDGGSGSLTVTSGPASGNVYELNKNQPYGSSWNTGADWTKTGDSTTGVVPTVGDIANAALGLRTPTSSGVFAARLNLQSGGSLLLKTSGTATLADGHLQGGSLSQGIAPNSTGTFGGFLAVDSDSGISINSMAADTRTMILAADLSGSGQLSVDGGDGAGTGTLRLTGDNAAYSGNWLVYDAASIEAQTANSLGSGAVTVNGGSLNLSGDQSITALNLNQGTATVSAAFSAGGLVVGLNGNDADLTATGPTFQVGTGPGSNLYVARRTEDTGTHFSGTLDLSGVTTVDINVGELAVASMDSSVGPAQGAPTGVLRLGQNNTIQANTILIGDSSNVGGPNGTVTFGANNDVTAGLVVVGGSKGTGRADIAGGGTLNLGTTSNPADLYVGRQPVWTGGGANGTLDLSGGTFHATLGTLTIAEKEASGSGTTTGVMIVDDGTVTADNVVMANHSGNGNAVATLTIRGGDWTVSGNVGEPATGGSSTLNIDGGTLNVGGNLIVDNLRVGVNGLTGSVTVTGGNVEIGSGTGNNLYVGHRNANVGGSTGFGFTGTLDLSAAASFTADVGTFGIGYVASNGSGQGWPQGLVTLSPDNTILANAIVVADSRGVGLGGFENRLTFGAANDVRANVVTFGGSKGRALVDIVAGGELNLASRSGGRADLYIGQQPVGTGGGSNGMLDLSGGTFNATLDQVVIGSKHADARGTTRGEMIFEAGTVDANSVLLADHNGTQGITYGTLRMRGGTLIAGSIAQGGGNFEFDWTGGRLTVGTFGFDLLQQDDGAGGGGTLAPGGSPGTTVVTGNYDMEAGIYEVEIAGLLQGVDPGGYDFVNVAGDANLGDDVLYQGGADSFLQVFLRDGFQPDLGDVFDVLTAADVTLGVDFMLDQSLSGLATGGFVHRVIPGGNGEILQLQFVPEPGTIWLAVLGLVCSGAFGWRRRSRIPW